jgi:tetratricopeptide (TPR) repeat protein
LGDSKDVARALSNLANIATLERDHARASSLYEECFAIFQGLGDRMGVAWSLNSQGDVARDRGNAGAAREYYGQGLAIFRELEDRWGIASTLADLGTMAREERDFSAAHSLYRESLKLFQELEHKRGIARLLECFAYTAAAQSHSERALRLAGAAAALRQKIGAPLTPAEKSRLESNLESARPGLSAMSTAAAWREGWQLPLDRAIEEALQRGATSPAS